MFCKPETRTRNPKPQPPALNPTLFLDLTSEPHTNHKTLRQPQTSRHTARFLGILQIHSFARIWPGIFDLPGRLSPNDVETRCLRANMLLSALVPHDGSIVFRFLPCICVELDSIVSDRR